MDLAFFDQRLPEYRCQGFTAPDLEIETLACSHIRPPEGQILLITGSSTVVRTEEHEICVYVKKEDEITAAAYYRDDYSRARIVLLREPRDAKLTLTQREYLRTGFAFMNRILYLGGTVLHGSAIAYRDQGIVFSAPSGTGKSTHTALWKERYGEDVVHINDDKPAIRFESGAPYLYGTPWSGKTDLNTNCKAPLKAVVFLKRGTQNSIRRLSVADSVYYLTDQTAPPFYDAGLGVRNLDAIEKIVETVPVYLLHCAISHEAVQTVYDEIFGRRDV